MSWLFSRALVEEFSEVNSLGFGRFAQLSEIPTVKAFSYKGSSTVHWDVSRSGTTCERLLDYRGEDLLTWYLAGFPARPSAEHLEDVVWLMISGRQCSGSLQMLLPGMPSLRTFRRKQSTLQQTASSRWVTKSDACSFPRRTWVQTTFGSGTGFLHTPTHTANYASPSMQKWPNCREFVRVFGKPTPENHEWLMGWPIGFTDLKPLETDKFQRWLRLHSEPSHTPSTEEAAA
jgi:hypothetical protein